MSKEAFAQTIIARLDASIGKDGSSYTSGSAPVAMAAVAQGITEYLTANTTVAIAYSGIIPGPVPTPDPVVADSFQIVGACAPTGPSDSFDDWIRKIESNIMAGFTLAPAGMAGVVFPQVPFLNAGIATSRSMLKAAHDIQDESPQLGIWSIVCGGIMDWINTVALNPSPGPATHPPAGSTGTASIVKITIV